jgi:hypothetical protein
MRLLRIVRLVAFLFPDRKFRTLIRMLVDKCLKLLNHSERKEVAVDEPSKDNAAAMLRFFSCHQKYQHQEPLKDRGILGVTVKEIWEDGDKNHNEFEYEKLLVTKQVHATLM